MMKKHTGGMHHVGHLKEVEFIGTPESMKERKEDMKEHMMKRKKMRHEGMEYMKKHSPMHY